MSSKLLIKSWTVDRKRWVIISLAFSPNHVSDINNAHYILNDYLFVYREENAPKKRLNLKLRKRRRKVPHRKPYYNHSSSLSLMSK